VADPGRLDLDQQLALARRVEIELGDGQRAGTGVRPVRADPGEHRGTCLHPVDTVTGMAEVNTRRGDYPVLRHITTRWADNDVYGHVNNVVYYAYFDTAVNGWLIEAARTDIRELPAIGIVAETGCRFLAPLSFPDPVTAGLRLRRLGRTSIVYEIALFRGDDDEPAGLGHFVHVYVDRDSRRPVPVPPEIRSVVLLRLGDGGAGVVPDIA